MFPDNSVLRKDYGKALSCHERALLFAADRPLIDRVKQRQEPPLPPNNQHLGIQDLAECEHITFLYTEATQILSDRLLKVFSDYVRYCEAVELLHYIKVGRGWGLGKKILVRVGDRDKDSTSASRDLVLDRLTPIYTSIRSRTLSLLKAFLANPTARIDRTNLKYYQSDWGGIDNICRLLMDEISYLRSRVDEFLKLLISLAALRRTFIAITIAIIAVAVNIFKDRIFPKEPSPEKVSTSEVAVVTTQLGSLSKRVRILSKDISALPSKFEKIKMQIFDNEADLTKQNEVFVENDVVMFRDDIHSMNDQASRIETALAANTSQLPQEVRSLKDEMGRVEVSLAKLEASIDRLSVPKTQPIKAWGIGSFRQEQSRTIDSGR